MTCTSLFHNPQTTQPREPTWLRVRQWWSDGCGRCMVGWSCAWGWEKAREDAPATSISPTNVVCCCGCGFAVPPLLASGRCPGRVGEPARPAAGHAAAEEGQGHADSLGASGRPHLHAAHLVHAHPRVPPFPLPVSDASVDLRASDVPCTFIRPTTHLSLTWPPLLSPASLSSVSPHPPSIPHPPSPSLIPHVSCSRRWRWLAWTATPRPMLSWKSIWYVGCHTLRQHPAGSTAARARHRRLTLPSNSPSRPARA